MTKMAEYLESELLGVRFFIGTHKVSIKKRKLHVYN